MGICLCYFLLAPANMEFAFLVCLPTHQCGQQIKTDTEFLVDCIQIGILSAHEPVQLFLAQHHLHLIGFNAANVGKEINVLQFRGGVPHESHIKLAHS